VAILCALLMVPGDALFAQQAQPAATPAQQADAKLPPEQLDSLVAPIALYPDPLLSQTLVASTYPLEVIQLQQWLAKNPGLKDKALTDAVMKQPWDPSIQAMAALPDAVKQLAENIKWTTDLGNAFLAQQQDVMDAVQRMRQKAQGAGVLKTNEQQKVETKVVETKTVVVIEQANPQVVYVPTYNPVVVYGPPVYPYPPIVYPPPPPPGAYVATAAIAFGVGMMVGSAYHGGWGYGCGWGHNDVTVNVNNNYNRNANINNSTNINRSGNTNTWQHNSAHRGGAPYANQATANRYGGTAAGQSRAGGAQAGAANRASTGGAGGNRGASAGNMSASGAGNRGASAGNMSASGAGSRGASASPSSASRGSSGAFGGASSSGSSARASSQRGASSMSSSRGGGGGSRGGGGGGRRR
jgi:hypothetical protein